MAFASGRGCRARRSLSWLEAEGQQRCRYAGPLVAGQGDEGGSLVTRQTGWQLA